MVIRGRMPVRSVVPDSDIVLAPLESDLVVMVLRYQLGFQAVSTGIEVGGEVWRKTYIEEISKNNIRFVLGKLNNTLRKTFVHKDAFQPVTADVYVSLCTKSCREK